jgi:hypothetical protein
MAVDRREYMREYHRTHPETPERKARIKQINNDRYANDPEYRARLIEHNRAYRAKKRAEKEAQKKAQEKEKENMLQAEK